MATPSRLTDFPDLLSQWHPTKNADLLSSHVLSRSPKKVWWLCPSEHTYDARVADRTGRDKTGCPFCSGRRAIPGETDLLTLRPKLSAFWDYDSNQGVDPKTVTSRSSQRYWWVCPEGPDHRWQGAPSNNMLDRCPFCSGRRLSVTNNLEATHPHLASEFASDLNDEIALEELSKGKSKKVWWRCSVSEDHIYEARVDHRASSGVGCPFCANRRPSTSNRLSLKYPSIEKWWRPDLNDGLRFSDPYKSGGTHVWRCDLGEFHYWVTSFDDAARNGCPKCSGRPSHFSPALRYKALPESLSLANVRPLLSREFCAERNDSATPENVAFNESSQYWWVCSKNPEHRFKQSVAQRVLSQNGCPYCSGRLASDKNSLVNCFPEVASEWHPERNLGVELATVTARSSKLYWWKCSFDPDHEWETAPANRCHVSQPTGCPSCAVYGFDPGRESTIYFLKQPQLASRKIGITHSKSRRLASWELAGWQVLRVWNGMDGDLALAVERSVMASIRNDYGLPQFLGPEDIGYLGGWTETFSADGPSDREIKSLIETELEKRS